MIKSEAREILVTRLANYAFSIYFEVNIWCEVLDIYTCIGEHIQHEVDIHDKHKIVRKKDTTSFVFVKPRL